MAFLGDIDTDMLSVELAEMMRGGYSPPSKGGV